MSLYFTQNRIPRKGKAKNQQRDPGKRVGHSGRDGREVHLLSTPCSLLFTLESWSTYLIIKPNDTKLRDLSLKTRVKLNLKKKSLNSIKSML